MWAIALKEFRQLRRDRRTLAMMIFLPLVLLVVFGYAASFDVSKVPTVVVGPGAAAVAQELPPPLDVTGVRTDATAGDGEAILRNGEAVAVVVADPAAPRVLVDGSELFSARAVVTGFAQAQGRLPEGTPTPKVRVLFNPDLETSAVMVPAIIGLILVFVGTVATSLGVVRERQAGTLEQLAVMPFRARDVFVGKVAPYFAVGIVDMAIVVAAGLGLFGVPFRGSVLTFALGALLFLFVTLGIGVLISTVSENQGQAIQMAIMTLLPQVLLSGMLFPLQSMAPGVRWIAYGLPLTYFIRISRGVMVRGAPLASLWFPLVMLAVLGLVVFGLSVIRFRRDLAPSGTAAARPAGRAGGAGGVSGAWGVRDLEVRYGGRVALSGVTLEVRTGEVAAVVGGDGAGKTTLLRALAGAVRPTAGKVERPGELEIGYVSAGPGVYGDLTCDENLAFAGSAYGLSGRDVAERAEGLLRRTGLLEARGHLAARLSGGMRHKLALAVGLLHRPELLVLDEPTTGVDPVSRADLWRLISSAAADGAAVLFATTYLDEAERAGEVLALDAGTTLARGTPEDVVRRMTGAVVEVDRRPEGAAGRRAWRRGGRWRWWIPGGDRPDGAARVEPDLEDAVIVAALAREGREAA